MASSPGRGNEDGGGQDAPDSGFRRRSLPVCMVAMGSDSCGFPASAATSATPSTAAYITPDPVLRAPGVPETDRVQPPGVQGCLWPPDLPVAGSHEMDTPVVELHTHVSSVLVPCLSHQIVLLVTCYVLQKFGFVVFLGTDASFFHVPWSVLSTRTLFFSEHYHSCGEEKVWGIGPRFWGVMRPS